MVHIPILKIDVPDPDITSLIPAAVALAINALTAVHDAVNDFLHPLTPAARAAYEEGRVAALPREIRKARKRIRERRIDDVDKQSSELEEASFAYYRRMIRTNWVGHSDENMEDATFRRMTSPARAGEQLQREHAVGALVAAAAEGLPVAAIAGAAAAPGALPPPGQGAAEGAAAGEEQPQPGEEGAEQGTEQQRRPPGRRQAAQGSAEVALPGPARRVAVTSAAGGAGLALGVGIVRLAALVARLRGGGKRRGKRPAGAAKGGQRRTSATGRGSRSGGGDSAKGAARGSSRAAPRS